MLQNQTSCYKMRLDIKNPYTSEITAKFKNLTAKSETLAAKFCKIYRDKFYHSEFLKIKNINVSHFGEAYVAKLTHIL